MSPSVRVSLCVCVYSRVAACHNDIIIYINEISAIRQEKEQEQQQQQQPLQHLQLQLQFHLVQLLVRLSLLARLIYGQFLLAYSTSCSRGVGEMEVGVTITG